jgi:DNA-binding transcriptional MerR regulator
MGAAAPSRLITVGGLARRTGMSRKTIRELEGLGLIYSAGRSEANYRLFDEQQALWCVNTVRDLRSLGLTLKEIQRLAAAHHNGSPEELGPELARLLGNAERRIDDRINELRAVQRRIADYRHKNAATLEGADLAGSGRRDSQRVRESA